MNISATSRPPVAFADGLKTAKKEMEVKPDLRDVADHYSMSRTAGNYASGLVLGAIKETITTAVQSPVLAWKIASNLKKAETIGPNLTFLGICAAIPAAVLSIPLGPFFGAYQGVAAVAHSKQDEPLTTDANCDVARAATTRPSDKADEPITMTGHFIKGLDKLGSTKLEPGEKAKDVPLLSPFSAIIGGVVSGCISGVVGLVGGLAAGCVTGGKEIKDAFTSKDKGFGSRVGEVLTSPLNLVVGPVLAWKSLKEAVPRGIWDGWKHGVVKPIADTGRISVTMAKGVIKEAWEK